MMTAGSVTSVNSDGIGGFTYVGTGFALAIAQALTQPLMQFIVNDQKWAYSAPFVFGLTRTLANALSSALVSYIQGNATAHVTTQQLGISTAVGTAINAPASPVDVPIT